VLDRLQEGVVLVDASGRVRDANHAAEAILGLRAGTLEGELLSEHVTGVADLDGRPIRWPETPPARAIAGEEVDEVVVSFRRADGSLAWLECEAGPLGDPDAGAPAGAVVTFHDVTYRIERERRFQHEADHDHLTGLANRRLLERTLDATIARAQHNARGVAVLMIDLDGFKAINDRHGHAVGDAVLREIASRLRQSLRERDLVARYGGDEFVLVIADLSRPEEVAGAFAERLVEVLGEPVMVDGLEVGVLASIGTACHPADGRYAGSLLTAADRAMYRAKQT
jgi:diguanylate cyclase (GGDEF)-like protein/PAS domain S-box-containing protein